MRYTILAATALALGACSQSDDIFIDEVEPQLYVVGYLTGEVEGTVYDNQLVAYAGPLPYGLDECEARAIVHEHATNTQLAQDGATMRIRCEYRHQEPEMENSVRIEG